MELIDKELLDKVCEQAKKNPRLRMNYNLHDSLDAKAQRLLNAMEPGTELPIHRHMHTAETYVVLRGRITVLFYDDNKQITESCELNPLDGKYGIHIPQGQWHTLNVIENDTIIMEVKDGPYIPLKPENLLK
ncbi:WbuC family cupin fold metalloprotein [uncultured Bacteroides sp.]|uniref:WbuC family cupin fold metalloprotein n=1 Tax=uncultured Bacteroides sp. TaxID=162156 RepID=UPI00280ABE0A|nr:WbuC family cupin fold metalloprotein [uncultured Bacteroides sp.]